MRICVTGGAGFIGSHLVDRLVKEGHEVSVIDDLSTGSLENLAGPGDRFEFVRGDVRERAAVDRAVRGAELVYHQAALASVVRSLESPAEVTDVNVRGTLNVLLAARDLGVRRVVFASSSSVYGDTPELPKSETMTLQPRSPYAASKAAGEAFATAFQHAYGLETVSFRYFNVYGPRQSPRSLYAAVVPLFVQAALEGRPPQIHGDGRQTRDFTYVSDVIDALCRAGRSPRAASVGPMNLGGGGRTSILDLVEIVARAVGREVVPVHEPARPGDVRDSLADIRRAREALGWAPEVDLAEGVRRILLAKGHGAPALVRPARHGTSR
jgi:UDP-glucose 4-epimerase